MELNEQLELLESYLVKQKHDLERKIDLIDDQNPSEKKNAGEFASLK